MIPQITSTLKKYGVKKAGIFGSYARNEQTEKSDIDILITPPENMNLLSFIGLKQDLEETLKIRVDLVSERALKPKLSQYIQNDLQIIYDES